MAPDTPTVPIPVLLVTGTLGAGKTTLINQILQVEPARVLAAIVNDFGAINIDETILSETGQTVLGLKNGCICCSLQNDLLRTLKAILLHPARVDGIVIEASGVADARAIIMSLLDPVVAGIVKLESVVVAIDGEQYDPSDTLWRAQIQAADFVVLTKLEDLPGADIAALETLLRSFGKHLIFRSGSSVGLPIDLFFEGVAAREDSGGDPEFSHIKDERFARLEWTSPTSVSLAAFQAAVQGFASQLARAKGFLAAADKDDQGYLFQLVGRRATLSPTASPVVGAQLVFIGQADRFDPRAANAALDELRPARATQAFF